MVCINEVITALFTKENKEMGTGVENSGVLIRPHSLLH